MNSLTEAAENHGRLTPTTYRNRLESGGQLRRTPVRCSTEADPFLPPNKRWTALLLFEMTLGDGNHRRGEIKFKHGENIVGADFSKHCHVDEMSINHFCCTFDVYLGTLTVRDMNSDTGTTLHRGESSWSLSRLRKFDFRSNQEYDLQSGDFLQVGQCKFHVVLQLDERISTQH